MDNEEHPVVEPTPPPETKRVWEPSQRETAELIADRLGEKQADGLLSRKGKKNTQNQTSI